MRDSELHHDAASRLRHGVRVRAPRAGLLWPRPRPNRRMGLPQRLSFFHWLKGGASHWEAGFGWSPALCRDGAVTVVEAGPPCDRPGTHQCERGGGRARVCARVRGPTTVTSLTRRSKRPPVSGTGRMSVTMVPCLTGGPPGSVLILQLHPPSRSPAAASRGRK